MMIGIMVERITSKTETPKMIQAYLVKRDPSREKVNTTLYVAFQSDYLCVDIVFPLTDRRQLFLDLDHIVMDRLRDQGQSSIVCEPES